MKQESYLVERRQVQPAGIPILTCCRADAVNGSLVFVQHGLNGRKENDLPFALQLAREGYFVVCPDARLHGERRPSDIEERFAPAVFLHNYIDLIEATAADISRLIDYFGRTEAGMVGTSMGGHITFLAAAREPRLKVVAPLIGSPILLPRPDRTGPPEEWARFNVIREARKIYPKAILVQNGDADLVVSIEGARRIDPVLRDIYAECPEKYRFITYPGVAHMVTEEMRVRAVAWIRSFLPPQ